MPAGSGGRLKQVEGFGDVRMLMTKRQRLEFESIVNDVRRLTTSEGMISRPFLKREVSKWRWLFPLDLESTLRFYYLNIHLTRLLGRCGWTELECKSTEIVSRRKYVIRRLSENAKKPPGEKCSFASDDGTDFNESHSWAISARCYPYL